MVGGVRRWLLEEYRTIICIERSAIQSKCKKDMFIELEVGEGGGQS